MLGFTSSTTGGSDSSPPTLIDSVKDEDPDDS